MACRNQAILFQGMLRLWDDLVFAQTREEVGEAVVRGLVVKEAQLSALAHVGHDLDGATEVSIGVPWRNQGVELRLGQMVLRRHISPYGCSVSQLCLQRRDLLRERCRLNAEPAGEAFPHPAPAEDITVH